jgi:hypothetical protein
MPKLTTRQQIQLLWLETLPPHLEQMKKIIELLAGQNADESQVRSLARICDAAKAQGSQVGLPVLADQFGYMAMLTRRAGGHQAKVRGLREMLAGARINFEGALREASTPERTIDPEADPDDVSS